MTLAAGQGKTIVFLLMLQIYDLKYGKDEPKSYLIITPMNILKKQLEAIINDHGIDLDITVFTNASFMQSKKKWELIIVDEADLFIQKYGVSFVTNKNNELVLRGVCNLLE